MTTPPGRLPVPAPLLVLGAIVSVQLGGALAVTLVPLVGVLGSVTARLGFALVILAAVTPPRIRGHSRSDWATAAAFGVALAAMNSAFYAALTRLPLGVTVTVEFVGPLVLAAALSRRFRDAMSVVAAAAGVALISGIGQVSWAELDLVGLGLAAFAGAMWAAYIILSGRTGARFSRLEGLTWAMVVATVLVAPIGIAEAGTALLGTEALVRGLAVAVLSSVLPYSLELLALRRMDARVFGVLLSLEPAVAALAGFLLLHQLLSPVQLLGMVLVVVASAAVAVRPAADADPAEVG